MNFNKIFFATYRFANYHYEFSRFANSRFEFSRFAKKILNKFLKIRIKFFGETGKFETGIGETGKFETGIKRNGIFPKKI